MLDIDKERLKMLIKEAEEYYYILGVEATDEMAAYCLMLHHVDVIKHPPQVVVSYQTKDSERFKEDVKALSRIFNAKIAEYKIDFK